MEKKLFILFAVAGILFGSAVFAQCDDYQMQIQNAVNGFYELSDNVFEANVLIDKLIQDPNSENFDETLDELKLFIKAINDNVDILDADLAIALSNAEMCYCRNGQKQTFMLIDDLESIGDYVKPILKLIKDAKKASGDKLISILEQIDSSLAELSEIATKTPEECIIATEACN